MTLWAVSIHWPDDLIAVADYTAAIDTANRFNGWWAKYVAKHGHDDNDPRMWAVPIEWPYAAAGHAEQLANPSVEYAHLQTAESP